MIKNILSFWSVLVFTFVLVAVFFRWLLASNMTDFNDRLHQEMLLNGVQSVQRETDRIYDMLNQMKVSKSLNPLYMAQDSMHMYEAQTELRKMFLSDELIQECILISPSQDFAISNLTSYRLSYFLQRVNHPLLKDCQNFEEVICILQENPTLLIAEKKMVAYTLPYNYMGTRGGARAVIMIDADHLLNRFSAYIPNEDSAEAVIYFNGKPALSTQESPPDYSQLAGTNEIRFDGTSYRVLLHDGENGTQFVYLTDDVIYQAPLTKAVLQFSLILSIIFLAGSVLIVLLARYNYRPVKTLQSSIENYLHRKRAQENEISFISDGIEYIMQENMQLNDRLHIEKRQLKNFFLFKLLNGTAGDEQSIKQTLSSINIVFDKDAYLCVSMALRNSESIEKFAIQIKEERSSEVQLCSMYYLLNGTNVVLIFNYLQKDEEQLQVLLRNFVSCYTHLFSMAVGIGEPVYDIKNISRSYSQSTIALRYAETDQAADILEYSKIHFSRSIEKIYNNTQVNALLAAIQKNDETAITRILADIRQMIQQNSLPRYAIKALYYQIVNAILVTSRNPALFEKGNEILLVIDEALQKYSLEELQEQIENLCHQLVNETHTVVRMDKILDYIKQHCCEINFSIASMADEFEMTYQQMISLFKKEMNMTAIEYVSEIKIATAAELLVSTSLSVSEIVKRTGYIDNSSFTRKFKQVKGMTPSEYRKAFGNDA